MKVVQVFFCVVVICLSSVIAHDNNGRHEHGEELVETAKPTSSDAQTKTAKLVTGDGDFVFSWDKERTAAFPEDAKRYERGMHGGFNEDPETGIVYTAIPGYGFCSISSDLKTWSRLGTDKRLKDNVHGICFFKHKGVKLLALAQQSAQRILVVDIQGNIIQEITRPRGDEFDYKLANKYYAGSQKIALIGKDGKILKTLVKANLDQKMVILDGGKQQAVKNILFKVTDVTYLDGRIYAVAGYSGEGDFVVTLEEKDGVWSWSKLAWGGAGRARGKFKTAHGIYAHDGFIYIANRQAHHVVKFTKNGQFIEVVKDLPRSLICNVAWLKGHFFFCPLNRVGKVSSAPIYVHTGKKLVSTIIPGELKIPILNNIHHAWPHYITNKDGKKKLTILIHGWNKGKFAVLTHEED